MLIEEMKRMQGTACVCGKAHVFDSRVLSGRGVIVQIPTLIKEYGAKHPYVLADGNTFRAAGEQLCALLRQAEIAHSVFCYGEPRPEPNEQNVGRALMHLPPECDLILAVGSGVLNDIGKILALHTRLPFFILATAPSMDGYASMTSSVTLEGIKVSLPSRCADVIIGDFDIIKNAPVEMFLAGIGDMMAKYVSICEWRIAALLLGEYYCAQVAALVRSALQHTLKAAPAALKGDADAVGALFDALIVGSVAMNYAGISRPASGVEHYVSHLYDTRGIEFGDPTAFHGTQCAVATLLAVRLYEKLLRISPDRKRALKAVEDFELATWNDRLRTLLGSSAKPLIALEQAEGKYDKAAHAIRLERILEHWEEILCIIKEELPDSTALERQMRELGMPTDFESLGMRRDLLGEIFCASKDIRDKYVLPRLLWDLGLLEEFASTLS